MLWPFRAKKIPHPDGVDAYYTPGIVFDGGAEHLAYRNDRPHPLITAYAGFIPHRQLQVVEPQTVYQFQSLPVTPLLPGVYAGQFSQLSLLEEGDLSGNANNDALNASLFGGVQ